MEYLIQESTLTNIADAIRTKKGQVSPISPLDMPDEIMSISGGGGGSPVPLATIKNGTYTNADGFNPVKIDVPAQEFEMGHTVNGKWVCPDDWDDVETIPLPDSETEQVLYLVYRTDLPVSYISYRVSGASYKYTKGHCVNGEFVATSPSVNKATNAYIQEFIESDFETSGKNTIVYKIEPQAATGRFTSTTVSAWNVDGKNYPYYYQSIVIRYGQLYYATSIPVFSYNLECDNVKNCKSLTSLNGLYYYTTGLSRFQKHRHDGWDTSKVTNFANMFYYCRMLTDCDMDFSNWVTEKCTTITGMFGYCSSLTGELNCKNWDTKNVTTIGTIFRECVNITKILGIETWYLPKCYGTTYAFYYCQSLYQNDDGILDLSNWHLGETATSTSDKNYMLGRCFRLKKINIQNFNFATTNTISNLFYENKALIEIDMRNITPPTSILINCSNLFAYCWNLKTILYDGDGIFYNWDVSKVTNMTTLFQVCCSLEEIYCGTPLNGTFLGSTSNSTCAGHFQYSTQLKTIDMSGLDIKNFTYNQLTNWFTYCYGLSEFSEFYPPQNINNNFTLNTDMPCLSKESFVRIINNLATQTSTKTLAIGTFNKSKLTAEEIAVATQKGWTVT